jgi:hypothetical protein
VTIVQDVEPVGICYGWGMHLDRDAGQAGPAGDLVCGSLP